MKNAAIGIVFDEPKTCILLTKRSDVPVWVLPGGGIEEGETPEEAALREVWEETGIHVTISRKCGEYYPANRLTRHTHVFECQASEGSFRKNDETSSIAYFSLNNLPENFFFMHRDLLNDAIRHPNKIVRAPLNRITYSGMLKYFIKHPYIFLRYLLTRITKKN